MVGGETPYSGVTVLESQDWHWLMVRVVGVIGRSARIEMPPIVID
jgi:hypothetical protein